MVRTLLFVLFLPICLFSKENDCLSDLSKALKKSSFERLEDLEKAYGPFDPDQAKDAINGKTIPERNEIQEVMVESHYNNRLKENDLYELTASVDRLEFITNEFSEDKNSNREKVGIEIHKCFESQSPELLILTRWLDIDVNYTPEEFKKSKICRGHHIQETYYWKSDAKKAADKYETELALKRKEKIVKSYSVDYEGGTFDDYVLDVYWTHCDDIEECKRSRIKKKKISPEKREIVKEVWIDENGSLQDLLSDPEATLVQKQCVDTTPSKTINGLLVSRPCWRESFAFLRKREILQQPDCQSLRNRKCALIETKCIEGQENDCQVWELTYECFNSFKIASNGLFLNQNHYFDPIEPNHSFSDVIAKLSVFQAMKEELANSRAADPLKVEIFQGTKRKCSKSVASDVVYDCCFSYSGLAKQAGLAKCNSDEIALASWKEQGQCHFIGVKENKALDLFTTDYEHVYCCFPSKLARVLNEQARKQLGIDWGSPEHVNCQGLTISQIQQLNFDKLNLEEAFEKDFQGLEAKYQDKAKDWQDQAKAESNLESIKQRMKEKLRDQNEN